MLEGFHSKFDLYLLNLSPRELPSKMLWLLVPALVRPANQTLLQITVEPALKLLDDGAKFLAKQQD